MYHCSPGSHQSSLLTIRLLTESLTDSHHFWSVLWLWKGSLILWFVMPGQFHMLVMFCCRDDSSVEMTTPQSGWKNIGAGSSLLWESNPCHRVTALLGAYSVSNPCHVVITLLSEVSLTPGVGEGHLKRRNNITKGSSCVQSMPPCHRSLLWESNPCHLVTALLSAVSHLVLERATGK